jgi:hypothetical protein
VLSCAGQSRRGGVHAQLYMLLHSPQVAQAGRQCVCMRTNRCDASAQAMGRQRAYERVEIMEEGGAAVALGGRRGRGHTQYRVHLYTPHRPAFVLLHGGHITRCGH